MKTKKCVTLEATLREPDQGKEDSITVVPPSVVEEFAPTGESVAMLGLVEKLWHLY